MASPPSHRQRAIAMQSHLPPSIAFAVRNFDDISARLLRDARNREPLPPEQLAAYQHTGDYQAQLPPLTDPRYLSRDIDRWLTTVLHSLSGALAAFAQAAQLQPQLAGATLGPDTSQPNIVTVAAAADHLRHVARVSQQLTAALAVHLDEAPFQPCSYDKNPDDQEDATQPNENPQPSESGEEAGLQEESY